LPNRALSTSSSVIRRTYSNLRTDA